MPNQLHRRDFLKLSALAGLGISLKPFSGIPSWNSNGQLARVATNSVSVYSAASDKSEIKFQRLRDDVLNVYYEVESEDGPAYNPIWYRVWGGFVHRAYLQTVRYVLNPVVEYLPNPLQLIEITVPWTQSYMYREGTGWFELYRLYYGSVHWIKAVEQGPDGALWYRIDDELINGENMDYYIPAQHARLIPASELTPLSPDVPLSDKRIEVDLAQQKLYAYEGSMLAMDTSISSGTGYVPEDDIPWVTPVGSFYIESKVPSKHMGYSDLTNDMSKYIYPGVPWVAFFEPKLGIAFHGTYWHTNFGSRMSHGCVNLPTDKAKWLFRWALPNCDYSKMETIGLGTRVEIY
jgi:lipoprotein-anchoring transpeptidase ErfK/SrfK